MPLSEGSIVRLRASGVDLAVGRLLGSGGQGAVHEVHSEDGQLRLALKWFRPEAATESQARRLRRILDFGTPSAQFLWPIDFADRPGAVGYGYVMPLRAEPMVPMVRIVRSTTTIRLRSICTAAIGLADAFLRLHALGLCYADISLNNVFADPATGEIEICDNDNVTIDGESSDVLGTPYFIAPEIVRGEAVPSAASDRYSLSVMLFMMLMRSHPLFGAHESGAKVLDQHSLRRLLGAEPVFVFDPANESNRPVADVHENALLLWPMLPAFMRALMTKAFTAGLTEPRHGRVTEATWRSAFERLRGLVRVCGVCGAEQFFDPADPDLPCAAPDCRAPIGRPARLAGRNVIVLEDGLLITRADLSRNSREPDSLVGDVVRHPTTGAIALRNRGSDDWTLRRDGGTRTVAPRAAIVAHEGDLLELDGLVLRIET